MLLRFERSFSPRARSNDRLAVRRCLHFPRDSALLANSYPDASARRPAGAIGAPDRLSAPLSRLAIAG